MWIGDDYGHFARYDDELHREEAEGFTWKFWLRSDHYPVVFVREIPAGDR